MRTTTTSAVVGATLASLDLFSPTTTRRGAFFKAAATTTTTTTKMNSKKNKRGEEEEETETKATRKERPENAFLESLRRETEENLRRLSDARVPPTRKFSQNDFSSTTTKEEEEEEKKRRFRNRGGAARMLPKEINGPRGLEPTRFNDWEIGGRCTDF